MILGDVEETITTVEIDDETYEEIIKVGPCSCLMMHNGHYATYMGCSPISQRIQGALSKLVMYKLAI